MTRLLNWSAITMLPRSLKSPAMAADVPTKVHSSNKPPARTQLNFPVLMPVLLQVFRVPVVPSARHAANRHAWYG